jgi:hypothetical protein
MNSHLRFVASFVAVFGLTAGLIQAGCGGDEISNRRYGFRQFVPSQGMFTAPLETKSQVLHYITNDGIEYMLDVSQYEYSGVRETTTRNLPALQRLTNLHLHLMSKTVQKLNFSRSNSDRGLPFKSASNCKNAGEGTSTLCSVYVF